MRATGLVSCDVATIMSIDLRPFGVDHGVDQILVFAEKGDVEGTLELGGHRDHTWDHELLQDDRISNYWEFIQNAEVKIKFDVEFGGDNFVAMAASMLGVALEVIAVVASVPWLRYGYVSGTLKRTEFRALPAKPAPLAAVPPRAMLAR